jgi:CDP-glucose 4,6-dehydratase
LGQRPAALEGVGGLSEAARPSDSWAGRRVLVTGATGMVGSWLTRKLVDLDAYAVALVCDHDPQSELLRSGTVAHVAVVDGRLEDVDAVERAVVAHDIDTIFHLGAQTIVGTAQRAPRLTFESNIQGTWNVLEAARIHRDLVRAVVVASSDKAYGAQKVLPYVEDMPLQGGAPYEVSKSCTDLLAHSYHTTYGLPVTVARCGNIYGGGDLNWSRIVPGTIRSLIRGEQPVIRSDGTFLRDYLFVDDVVDAYLLLGEASRRPDIAGEAFNFSDESPLTVMEVYERVCAAAGRPGTEPRVLGRAEGEIRNQYLSAAKARERLGWKATHSLDEGLRRTVSWYADLFGVEGPR